MATAKKKSANGAGTVERRGELWWVQVLMPRAPGERAHCPRVPIAGSEKMTEAQAKRAGAKTAADVRAGRIVFDVKPGKGAIPSPSAILTVRQLGEKWTSGELVTTYATSTACGSRRARRSTGGASRRTPTT